MMDDDHNAPVISCMFREKNCVYEKKLFAFSVPISAVIEDFIRLESLTLSSMILIAIPPITRLHSAFIIPLNF